MASSAPWRVTVSRCVPDVTRASACGTTRRHPRVVGREERGQAGLGHHHGRPGVPQHVGEAVGRIGRVQRHVGAARLEHGEQGGDHASRALHAEADKHVEADAKRPQPVRQPVGPRVERVVGQGVVSGDDGDGSGGARHLRLEEPGQAKIV